MGGSNSKLDCMSKKSKERKKQIEKNRKGLSDNIIGHRDAVDGLQSKATKLVSRVSTRDRALVEGRLGDSEKKFSDITDQVEKTKRQYDIIDANLDDIKEEVDQYLEWLKEKEDQLTRETPRGYSVKEAETKLAQNNDLRKELEEKRATLDRVKQKSDGLVQDLSRVERNMVERWVARLSTENQKVMEIVESQNKLLAEQAGEQAIFQESLEKVNLWLHDKDQEVQKLKHIRLTSSDVDKQIEKSKTLHSEVLAHNPHVENLRKLVEPLLVDCSPELAAELKQKLSDVQERYESLLNSAKQENGNLRDHVAARKLFEADVHKVDRWCKDTEISCSTEPNLECAIEVLQEQCKHYKNLENTSQLFASLVKEIEDRGATFLPTIYDADKVKLEGTMKSTKEKYNRVAALVKDRVESTETALQSRSQVHESLTEATDWLQNIQDEIKQLQGTPVGSTTEDANQLMEKYEDIGEKIANYQPSIAQLNQAVERLRSNGQNMEADEILQLTSQYEMALDKVEQESMKCKQAVAFRQNYTTQKAQLEAAVHECEDELNEVAQSGMPITERIQKFKVITDKLQSIEPLFMVVSDKAHELSVASGEDARPITDSIQNIKSHIDQLKKQADKKTKQCDRIQKSRTEFDNSIDEAIVWLEQKEDILASCTAQEMEPDKLMVSLQKHNALAREALDKIAAVKDKSQLEKAHYEKLGEPIPATMEDKLKQIKSLEDSIKEAIAKKENYLEEAKTDRMQFEMSMKQINDWISGAEEMLDSGYEGTDYDTLTDTISEHKDYFSEASMCQDEMEQVMEISERLLPTLDNNDKETLRQTLKNTNKKLSDVMAASQRRQQTLEKRADDWQEYKDMVFNVTEQLQELEEQWSACEQLPVATPAMVQQQLTTSKGFLSKIEDVRSSISDINDRSRELEKDGNSVSRSFISRLADDLNDRYNTLTTTTENKQMTLQNLKGQWDEYTTLLEDVENLVNTAEHSLPTIEVETAHNHELLTNLNDTKQICTQIQVSEPKIEALKRCTENLQRNLPTAEAKIHTQEKLMNLLEKLERVQDNANEYHIALQEEIDDRGSFQTEADQTVQWLNEAKMELERLDPGKEVSDVVERIEKQKVLQQEVAIRMDQMEHAAQLQKAKYSALGKDLPEDLEKQIIDMKDLETDVATVMKVKEQELQNIKADREEVTSSLKDVSLWLTDAELRLQDRIINIPDSLHHLQVLQSEFDDFKPVLDKLRKRGSDLIQHTPDTIEKQLVQKALADTNRQWLALQGKAAEKTRKLEEAKDLIQNFDEIANPLEKWLNNAESVVKQDATWTNFDTVRDQLKQQRKLAKDLDNQQDKLSNLATISKRLEPICDAAGARDKLSKLNKRMFNLHSKASEKLNTLEEITDDIDDYEDELTRLRLWMDETKSHLTMRDTTLTLKEQLAIQEKILEDIESHKGKALLVEQKQSELKNISGKEEPAGGLSSELSELHQMAREQCEALQESMVQQEQYESDVRHLSSAITEAQDKLLNAPVQASNVNTLKKQIAEHNALASQIKSYQDKIYDINEKSKHLTDRSLGMRPAMIEKLSQMGYRYPSSLPSLKVSVGGLNDRSGPDSGIFVSPENSFNMTQRSVSDADFSSSTLPSGKTGHSSGRQHDPGSISGRSDDTDITMENYPGLFDQYDSQTQKRSRGHGQPQRSRSPSPYLSEERIIKKQHEPVQMSSVSQPRSSGSMGQSLHRNVASQSLQPFSEMEVSASVPNLLEPQLMVPRRERSASFGAKLKPKFDDIALLNTSWNTLQHQLGAREHELQVALQKQERYQQSVQDVTLKMERTQSKLARTYPSSLVDLDRQLKDYRESLTDIDSIREDIARVRERGRQIVEMSDPEGYNTMQATLSMLTDRVDNLQALADTKGKQLQNAVKDKEKHDISLSAYKKHLGDLEGWLEEMKIRQAATPLPTDSVQSLRQYLHDNQTLQEELNNRLQLVSDLAVQCDALCERETPANAEKLRSQLTNLQTQLGNLKLAAIEKQGPIRAAIKESEKRQKEMDDYEMKVKKLQDWVSDTKQIAMVPPKIETLILPEDHQSLQQQLRSELSEHRQLVQQLSTDAPSYQTREPEVSTVPPISEEELVQRWQELNEELNQKKEQLEDLLRGSRSWEPRGQGYSWLSPTDTQGQLKDIRHNLEELNNLWQQLTTQVVDKQLRLDQALDYQQKYQDALQNISQWLDLAEQKIMSPDGDKDSQQQLRENEALQRDIKSLQNEITAMARNSQDLLTSTNRESQELVTCSLGNLNERVQLLENQAQRQGEKLRHADRKWKEYRDEVQILQRKLAEIRSSMATQSPTASLDELVSHMQKMETQLKTCEGQLRDLRYKGEEISVVAPKMINPTEIKALQTNYMELQQKVMDKKADLLQSVSVQDQYEKLLADYAEFLETANEKLKTETTNVKDLHQLKQQLASHKEFFNDLEVNRAMLDTLSQQCDKNTQQSHLSQHTRLNNLTYVILDKASLQGQRLERMVRQWLELSEKYDQLQGFLNDIERQMPRPVANDDSIMAIQEKINTYHRLQRELTDEKPTVFQVVDKGKQLLHSLNCPGLETEVTDLAEKWVSLNTKLSLELKRTEKLGEQLQAFEAEAAVLRTWLLTAKMKLTDIKHLSEKDQQSIATIRSKNDKLLEFRKEVEDQEGLKNKIMFVGKQLSENQTYNTAALERNMTWLEEQWGLLEHDINKAEEYLHQAQMDLMPSRQALTELATWLNEMEEAVRQEKSKTVKNMADIEISLKKFKDFKIEVQNKQLTIDFVNQSSLQTGTQDHESIPYMSSDKTEFAERLGTLNKRWQSLSHDVNEQLRTFEMLQKKWEEYESSLSRLQDWFQEQEDKIKQYRLIGHEVSVKQTLKECKMLQQTLKAKEEEIDQARSLGERLVELSHDSPGCQRSIQHSLDNLNKRWQHLYDQVQDLRSILNELLSQWEAYHKELQGVNQVLSETEYCLSRYTNVGADLITLRMQVEKLKGLQSDVDKNIHKYDRCLALGSQLMQVCETPAKQDIQKTMADVQGRWQKMCVDLHDRLSMFEVCLTQWQQYEHEYNKARRWLDAKERLCNELVAIREDTNRRDECLQESKALQRDLDDFQSQLSSLYHLSDSVTKNMDTPSITNLTSRLSSLDQRVMALRQILSKQVQMLQGDLSQRQRFKVLFDSVSAFVNRAAKTLSVTEPSKTSETPVLQSRYEKLKVLTTEFADNMTELDSLNDLGYRLALDETSAINLRELNHKWHELYSDAKEHSKEVQGALLVQQDFTGKCDTWMTFLAETEQDLSMEIGGSLPELINQLRKCEKFESDMYSKQQILHAIISDGQKMMKDGEVENRTEFQNKLHLLAEQWQSVVRRANQRKAIIEASIKQWRDFNDLTEKLRDWLADKEYGMTAFDVDSVSLQKVKNLLEKAQNMQNEFKLQEESLKQINAQAQPLLQKGDDKAKEHIKVSTAQLEQHWHHLNTRLEEQCKHLEGVLKQWQECEGEIEDISSWLKDTRLTLTAELPTAYDRLQAELNKCKEIEAEFAGNEPRKEALLEKENKLGEIIQPEDLNVLHQRIRLLNKQWEELRNQAVLRQQKITDNMCRWAGFNDRVKEMLDWMEKMELKVISSQEYHIEDLLHKLQQDYRDEMAEKERTKIELISQGHQLAKVSSEVRAADIESKLQRLEDKWLHVTSVMAFRQRKLQETLLAVQQLDISMANLRKWLAGIEHDLSTPVIYQECSLLEIQHKLQIQQEIQKDIEHHSAGVGSVLNLCEVLLHDTDACPSEKEFDALENAMKSLDKRWRNICILSPEMRSSIEETWGLWQTLLDDSKMFCNWLDNKERDVSDLCLDTPSIGPTREEVAQFEIIQKEIHDNLSQLEDINKQYRKLAREGRTDHSGILKQKMQDANDRWDKLQQYVSSIMRKLKHSANLREDFNHTRNMMYNWLTDMQVQLTNIQLLSSMDPETKLREIERLQDEINSRSRKMDYLDQSAVYLIQKGDSKDAVKIQRELDDFKQFYSQVINQVNGYHSELEHVVNKHEDDIARAESQLPGDELDELERQLKAGKWDMTELEAYLEASPPESPPEKRRHIQERSVSPVLQLRSTSPVRSRTPPSRSRSPTRSRSRSPSHYASRSPVRSPARIPARRSRSPMRSREAAEISRQERWRRLREELSLKGREAEIEALLENLVDAIQDAKDKLCEAEEEVYADTRSDTGTDDSFEDYFQCIRECEMSIDNMKRIERLVKTETGVYGIASADVEIKDVLQRWELLQARMMDRDYKIREHRQDWSQFKADLEHMLAWLNEIEALHREQTSGTRDITELDSIIRHHKDFLIQLESKKARVLSINLTSKNFIHPGTQEGRELRDKLRQMNRRWEAVCERANNMQKDLKMSLMHCEEFHHTIHDLLLWLEKVETKVQQCEPINRGPDDGALWTKLRKLKELKIDMETNQPRVQSLKETADQLLMNDDSTEMVNAKDKTHIISNRLRALIRLCKSYIVCLEERLNVSPESVSSPLSLDLTDSRLSPASYSARTSTPRLRYTQLRPGSSVRTRSPFAVTRQLLRYVRPFWQGTCQDDNTSTELHDVESQTRPSYFRRIVRTALPLQILLLVLLGIASLVPMTEEDYSCVLMNNFRRSLGPMLRYNNGPPPM